MTVAIRASVGDDALDYTITDSYGTIYWKDSFLPGHIESFGRGDELFVRRGDVAMKIDSFIPMNYVKSSFEAAEAKAKRDAKDKLPVTEVSGYMVTDTRPEYKQKLQSPKQSNLYAKRAPDVLRERVHVPSSQWYPAPTLQNQASIEEIYGMSVSDYQMVVEATHKQQTKERDKFLQKELDLQRLQQEAKSKTVKDIRDMTMDEYAAYRREVLGPQTHKPMGVSLRTGSEFLGTDYNTHPKSPFDLWKDARDKFIEGDITDINEVLKHVKMDEDGYSKIVDMEIAEERAAKEVSDGLHKHRFCWSRWFATWRLGAWFHR